MAEVLSVHVRPEEQHYYSSPLRKSAPSQSNLFAQSSLSSSRKPRYGGSDYHDRLANSLPSTATSSPRASHTDLSRTSSFPSTSSSSLSDLASSYDDHTELAFPSYSEANFYQEPDGLDPLTKADDLQHPPSPTAASPSSPEPTPIAEDDTAIAVQPSRHVDYLSHEWREEDIWSSWKHIVSKRRYYGERSRLENASWRTWAKQKYGLKTISPETLNWLKDCDVTWLYGPLQQAGDSAFTQQQSEPSSNLSKSSSFIAKKPILKKRTMSEVMLQRSISTSSLVKQAAAAVQAQQDTRIRERPYFGRGVSDFVTSSIPSQAVSRNDTDYFSSRSTSGLQSPAEQGERRHIRFDDTVEQCIAVELKGIDEEEEEEEDSWEPDSDDDDSDDGIVMMKKSKKKRPALASNRTNSSVESAIIAKLPSTTLKYRTDSPDIAEPSNSLAGTLWANRASISPSPSQETLKPSHPSRNFLLGDDEDEDAPMDWQPSGAFSNRRDSISLARNRSSDRLGEEGDSSGGLRRTASGMFMPYDEEEDSLASSGLFGKVIDTINTTKDIAHVIWNVGWRK